MASRERRPLSREQVQTAYARLLLQRVREDRYPSGTHMALLEETLPPSMTREYLSVLFEKVRNETYPSITMLRRIQRIAHQL